MLRILYILFAVGAVLVVLALTMVFVNDDAAHVDPQSQPIELAIPDKKQAVVPNNALPAVKTEAGTNSNPLAS